MQKQEWYYVRQHPLAKAEGKALSFRTFGLRGCSVVVMGYKSCGGDAAYDGILLNGIVPKYGTRPTLKSVARYLVHALCPFTTVWEFDFVAARLTIGSTLSVLQLN